MNALLKISTITLFILRLEAAAPIVKSDLLKSYDLEGTTNVVSYANDLCPTISKGDNVCSYKNQLTIYKKWVISKER